MHPADEFRNKRAKYFAIVNKHGFSKAFYALEKDHESDPFNKNIYNGLFGELVFLKEGSKYNLTPTLDCGDHCDFIGMFNNSQVRFDVTTSLEYKNLDDYEKLQRNGCLYQIALIDINSKKIDRIIDVNIPFCKVCGARLINTLIQVFNETRQGTPTQTQTVVKVCSNDTEHDVEYMSFNYYLPSMADDIEYLDSMCDDDNDEILKVYRNIPVKHGVDNSLFFSKLIQEKIHACGNYKYITTRPDGDGYWGNEIYWITDLVRPYIRDKIISF